MGIEQKHEPGRLVRKQSGHYTKVFGIWFLVFVILSI